MTNVRDIELRGNWRPAEVQELHKVLAPLPRAWVENNPSFRALVREAELTDGPPEAPGHSKYDPQPGAIVVYDKGVYHDGKLDPEQFRRSIYHELAHSIIRSNPQLLKAWSGNTGGDGFVDDYAKTSPEEDFADTLSEFFIHNGATDKVVPRKAAFLRNLLDQSEEKVAMHFLNAFTDELIKTAISGVGASRSLSRLVEMAKSFGRSGAGKATAGIGIGGVSGAVAGQSVGETHGYKEGTEDLVDVAQQARKIGRQEGIMAYDQYMKRLRRKSSDDVVRAQRKEFAQSRRGQLFF